MTYDLSLPFNDRVELATAGDEIDWRWFHLFEREDVFKQLNPDLPEPQYAILWEDPKDVDATCKVTTPAPVWLAMAMEGGILPPVEVYHELAKDEAAFMQEALKSYPSNAVDVPGLRNSFRHTRGHLLHDTPPLGALTEEEAMEYLVMKDIPAHVWSGYEGNRTVLKIVPRHMIPTNRMFRNAWRIAQDQEEMETADV